MKKKLFLGLLAAAAVSFTACQKDEVISEMPQDNAIGFGTYVGRDAMTKASVTDQAAMESNLYAGFGVFAYYTGSEVYADTFTYDFMNNQPVKWDSEWDYNPKKYWPGGTDKVSFFAYAPYTDVSSTPTENITGFGYDNTAKGNPTLSFTVEDDVDKQIDLLYATPQTDKTTGTISFEFFHALTRIGFKVKTVREDYRVNISKITLEGDFNTVGTLNLNTGAWSGENNETDTDTYILNFNNANQIKSTTGTAISATEGYVMTIPTNFTSSDLSVTVNYTYEYEVSSGIWATKVNDTKTGTVNTNFEKGKAYTLVMTLDPMNLIQFSVTSVTGWNEDHTGYNPGTDVNI